MEGSNGGLTGGLVVERRPVEGGAPSGHRLQRAASLMWRWCHWSVVRGGGGGLQHAITPSQSVTVLRHEADCSYIAILQHLIHLLDVSS
jgi:hypothetical protein